MATYVIDPGGGGDFTTLNVANAAGKPAGTVFEFVDGTHTVSSYMTLANAYTLRAKNKRLATLTSSLAYILQGPAYKTTRFEGMRLAPTGAKGLNIAANVRMELDGDCEVVLDSSASGSDKSAIYVNSGGTLATEKDTLFSGGYLDSHHFGVFFNAGISEIVSPIIECSGIGIQLSATVTGSVFNPIINQAQSQYNIGIQLDAGSSADCTISLLCGISGGYCIWARASNTPSAIKCYHFSIDHFLRAIATDGGSCGPLIKNWVVSDIADTAFFGTSAPQSAPDYIVWDESGTLATGYTTPTNITLGDPDYSDAELHIPSTSPARGAGSLLAAVPTDADGVSFEDPPACGCYEADTLVEWTLTYNAGAGGTIDGDTPQVVIEGEDGTEVTAVPDEGYSFVEWDDLVETAARQDLAVTADITVEASFEIKTYEIAVSLHWDDGGTVTGADTYDHGETVVLEAVANSGFVFAGWREGTEIVSLDAELTFEAVEARTFVALFISQEQADVTANGDWLWYWLPARMKKKIRSESMIGTFCTNWGATLDAAKDFLRAIIPEYLIATAQSDTLDRLSRFRQTYRGLGETDESLRTRTMIAYETKRKDGTIPGMESGLAGLGYTVTVSEPNKGTDHWSRFVISVTAWDGVVADIGYFFALVTRMKPAHTRALIESALEECLFDDWEDGIDDPLLFDEGYFDDWLPD